MEFLLASTHTERKTACGVRSQQGVGGGVSIGDRFCRIMPPGVSILFQETPTHPTPFSQWDS